MADNITYHLWKFVPRGKCTIVQKQNGNAVNEYDAYYYDSYFVLVPRRRINPSTVPLKRKTVSIQDVKREF